MDSGRMINNHDDDDDDVEVYVICPSALLSVAMALALNCC